MNDIECPFTVGDRILRKYDGMFATVTEVSSKSFKYKLDNPICIHPLFGSYQEVQCFSIGYSDYELLPPGTPLQIYPEISTICQSFGKISTS